MSADRDVVQTALDAALEKTFEELGAAIPPAPQMTAETAEDYVRNAEEFDEDVGKEQRCWEAFEKARQRNKAEFDKIHEAAFWNEREQLSHAHLQALCIKYLDSRAEIEREAQALKMYYGTLRQNIELLIRQTLDVLAHRPAQHALMDPAKPARFPVDTPTAGPRVTDEAALLDDLALSFMSS